MPDLGYKKNSHYKAGSIFFKKITLLFILCGALFCLSACTQQDAEKKLSGSTMGTTYHITMVNPSSEINLIDLQQDIDMLLHGIEQTFSTYKPDSELSRLNKSPVNEWVGVSDELFELVSIAQSISEQTNGAYDITVGALVDLWGFGSREVFESLPPNQDLIQQAKQKVCYSCIELDRKKIAIRKTKEIEMDLSSIAKGYAVDQVADLIYRRQIYNYLVEIGGEARTLGVNGKAKEWRMGIESPETALQNPEKGIKQVVQLSDKAQGSSIASSGDYRNFVLINGVHYSHIINPVTGYPVTHNPASVTVIASSTMLADAWATAFTVLGLEKSLKLAEEHNIAAYFLSRSKDARLNINMSSSFKPYLVKQ